jgi:hypothetical protein
MAPPVALEVDGRQVTVTNPDRVIFRDQRCTELDLIRYHLAVAEGALPGAPAKRPDRVDAAGLVWAINLGCTDLNSHAVLAGDLDHPDELRVDPDPMRGAGWRQVLDVAVVAREVLAGPETWRDRHPAAADRLQPADVLVNRGPRSIRYRIRINLQHGPDDQRHSQGQLIADYRAWPKRPGQ